MHRDARANAERGEQSDQPAEAHALADGDGEVRARGDHGEKVDGRQGDEFMKVLGMHEGFHDIDKGSDHSVGDRQHAFLLGYRKHLDQPDHSGRNDMGTAAGIARQVTETDAALFALE